MKKLTTLIALGLGLQATYGMEEYVPFSQNDAEFPGYKGLPLFREFFEKRKQRQKSIQNYENWEQRYEKSEQRRKRDHEPEWSPEQSQAFQNYRDLCGISYKHSGHRGILWDKRGLLLEFSTTLFYQTAALSLHKVYPSGNFRFFLWTVYYTCHLLYPTNYYKNTKKLNPYYENLPFLQNKLETSDTTTNVLHHEEIPIIARASRIDILATYYVSYLLLFRPWKSLSSFHRGGITGALTMGITSQLMTFFNAYKSYRDLDDHYLDLINKHAEKMNLLLPLETKKPGKIVHPLLVERDQYTDEEYKKRNTPTLAGLDEDGKPVYLPNYCRTTSQEIELNGDTSWNVNVEEVSCSDCESFSRIHARNPDEPYSVHIFVDNKKNFDDKNYEYFVDGWNVKKSDISKKPVHQYLWGPSQKIEIVAGDERFTSLSKKYDQGIYNSIMNWYALRNYENLTPSSTRERFAVRTQSGDDLTNVLRFLHQLRENECIPKEVEDCLREELEKKIVNKRTSE